MYLLFSSPPATGKTTHAELLRKHFDCHSVVEAEALRHATRTTRLREHTGSRVLVLGTDSDHRLTDLEGFVVMHLSNRECNEGMMAVGGHRIWNEDGSRYEVKPV